MPELLDKIEAARAKLARLERQAAHATCAQVGCNMESIGGANCGCVFEMSVPGDMIAIVAGECSVPVLRCTRCGDSDYGDNAEAREIRERCKDDR